VLVRVPEAIYMTGTLVLTANATISSFVGYELTRGGTAGVIAAVASAVGVRLLRRPTVYWSIRAPRILRRYGHCKPQKALREFPRYPELFDHLTLLGISLEEVCKALEIRPVVARYFREHRQSVLRPELLEPLCHLAMLPLAYLRGEEGYGDEYTQRRLVQYLQKGMARGWTLLDIFHADKETRKEILAAIEKQLREDLNLPNPGGGDE
jgi:hypothetical protein